MTSRSSRRTTRRPVLAGIVMLCTLGMLPGCTAGRGDTSATGGPSRPSGTLPELTGKPAPTATSDVVGRAFDIGTIAGTAVVGGVLTIELDRWTVNGTTDALLAKSGMTVSPHTGDLFTNQNDDRTRTVPVAPGAQIVINTCVRPADGADQPLGMTSDPAPADDWLEKPDRKAVLLLTYDPKGRITRMDTDPRC